jgi:uncharacterized protein
MNITRSKIQSGLINDRFISMGKFCILPIAYLLLFFSSHLIFAQKSIPELWGQRVHDEAHILKPATIDQLEKDLKLYEDSTTNQIAILIVQNLDGETIEDYSLRVAEKWKLGTKSKDNGVLLLIAIDDHKMRIEVGHGLEGALTDAQSNRIIRNEMAPNFRRSDYDAGLLAAISAMKSAIGGEYSADEADDHTNDFESMNMGTKILIGSIIFIFLGIFASIGLFSEGAMTWVLYVFLIPFYAGFMGLLLSWWFFLGYLIVYPILRLLIAKSGKKLMKWQSSGGGGGSRSSGSSWSSGGSSSWGSSSGGSSFSGGGGSFGGGGSSGSW